MLRLLINKNCSSMQIRFFWSTFHTVRQYTRNISTVHAVPVYTQTIPLRFYSGKIQIDELTVDYNHVKNASLDKNILIIDVREPEEVKEHGKIPNSINIPLGNVSTALGTMSNNEFQTFYERSKPSEENEIIFYCMIGKRSGMAQQNAINLGYKNVKNYLGSWNDWASNSINTLRN